MSTERTDYTSRVPHYDFPSTLAEQEAALADHPMTQRLSLRAQGAACELVSLEAWEMASIYA